MNICRNLVHLDSLGPPGVSSRPLGSHPSTPCVVRVFVFVYTHIHPRTLPPASKNTEHTDKTPIPPSVKNNPLRPATIAHHRLANPPHPRSPTTNEQTAHTRAHVHTLEEFVCKCVCWCQIKTCITYTPAYTMAPRTPISCTPHPPQTNADTPVHARLYNGPARLLSKRSQNSSGI